MIYRRRLTRAELRQRANHKMISGSWNDEEENEPETQLKNIKNTGRWITPILGTFVLTLFIFLLFWNLYHFFQWLRGQNLWVIRKNQIMIRKKLPPKRSIYRRELRKKALPKNILYTMLLAFLILILLVFLLLFAAMIKIILI